MGNSGFCPQELCEKLQQHGLLRSPEAILAYQRVDRGDFVTGGDKWLSPSCKVKTMRKHGLFLKKRNKAERHPIMINIRPHFNFTFIKFRRYLHPGPWMSSWGSGCQKPGGDADPYLDAAAVMGFGAQVSAPHVHCAALELIQVPILRELREILRTTVPGVTPPDTYIYKIYIYDYIYILLYSIF